jgi:hypothetical protein
VAENPIMRPRMATIFIALIFMALSVTCQDGSAKGLQVYRNPAFGFSVRVPSEIRLCESSGETIDHNLRIPLVSGVPCNKLGDRTPEVDVYAGADSAHMAATTKEMAEDDCQDEKPPSHAEKAPADISFPSRVTYLCRISRGDQIAVRLMTLLRKPTEPVGTHFEIALFTTNSRLEKDMVVFKKVLAGLTFDGK